MVTMKTSYMLEMLLLDADKRAAMAAAATKLGRPDAAAEVAKVIQGIYDRGRTGSK